MKKLTLIECVDQVNKTYRDDPFRRAKELNKLLRSADKSGDVYTIGLINLYLSICVFDQGRRGRMLSYAYKAVSIFEKFNDHLLARSYNLLGIAYAGNGSYQNAIAAYQKAIHLVRGKKNPSVRKETLMNNIGDAYFQMGAFHKSLRISLSCLSNCQKKNPDNHRAIVLYGVNCSDNYCSLCRFQNAKAVLETIAPNAEQLNKSTILCAYYTRKSYVLYQLGDVDGGAKYADIVLDLIHAKFDTYEFHYYIEQIATSQIKFGDMERARHFSDILTKYAAENEHSTDQITAKRVEALISYASGDHNHTLELYKEISAHYEDLLNENKIIQYESQKSVDEAQTEIGKLMQTIRVSEEKAERDPLTGLMNRSALVSVTTEFIQTAKEKGKKIGGIFLDIDYFKEFNDTYGHAEGDVAIKLIAEICMEEESEVVKFFRYGGDEYFGIALGFNDEELEKLALQLHEKIRSSGVSHVKNPNGQRLTVSIGIVNIDMNSSDETVLDIINFADNALYHAKDRGKDDVFSYCILPNSEHVFKRVVKLA